VEETVNTMRSDPGWLSLQKIPDHTRKALLAIEDHDFYKHGALDITGIARAAFANLKAGEVQQGGSTLTQQMVKNVFLSSEQTFARKAEEAVLATWVERKYSKDEVLEMYFNSTYFGAGAYGLRDAARKYFGKDPALLTIPESAMLAAMPYAPSALNPYENPSGCAKRVRLVLKEMLRYGYIGNTEYKDALARGVVLKNGRTLLLE
jgi:membrane peptidoglycan carboxypeptidase